MKFELKPDNRNSSDDELLEDLIKVSKELGKTSITRKEYNLYGRFSEGTLRKRFGGWLNALEKSGLNSTKDYDVSEEELINELKRISMLPSVKVLSKSAFNKHRKISNTTKIERHFGSWANALKKSGVDLSRSQVRFSEKDLFENLMEVWMQLGKQPTMTNMNEPPSKITPNTYANRFGNWRNALESFIKYANEELQMESKIQYQISDNKKVSKITKPKHKTSRTINLRQRFLILQRDNFKCKICGRSPAFDAKVILNVDHIYPWSKGGETVLENLQTLCFDCNNGKSDLIQ